MKGRALLQGKLHLQRKLNLYNLKRKKTKWVLNSQHWSFFGLVNLCSSVNLLLYYLYEGPT